MEIFRRKLTAMEVPCSPPAKRSLSPDQTHQQHPCHLQGSQLSTNSVSGSSSRNPTTALNTTSSAALNIYNSSLSPSPSIPNLPRSSSSSDTLSANQCVKRIKKDMSPPRPSFLQVADESKAFSPGDHLGIYVYVPQSTVSFRVSITRCLRQSNGPKVFVFYGQGRDQHVSAMRYVALACEL